jgi:hypothetical protein
MVAAMCMVLYGYDASVFNSVQGSNNWLNYFDLDAVSLPQINAKARFVRWTPY